MTNEERIKKHLEKSNVAFLSNFQGTDFEIRMFVEDITDQYCHPHTDVTMDGVAFSLTQPGDECPDYEIGPDEIAAAEYVEDSRWGPYWKFKVDGENLNLQFARQITTKTMY